MGFVIWLTGVVSFLVGVVVLVAIVRRLLGVHVSFLRSAVAAAVALLIARPLLGALVTEPEVDAAGIAPDDPAMTELVAYVALLTAFAFVVAMVLLVIAEVLVPDGSVPGPLDLWRSWRARLNRSGRYVEILRIVTRHGLARFLRGGRHLALGTSAERHELARALRRALEDGGVTFVKLGQQLSTRHDLLPEEFTRELAQLQDAAAPIPWEQAREQIRTEIGTELAAVFAEIDDAPLAAASIAQVHAARLRTGEDVVVKVQRPEIDHDVDRDLDILNRLARTLDARTDWGAAIGVQDLAAGFAVALREELDFRVERDNLLGVAAGLADLGENRRIRVPEPVPALSTSRVLVMNRLDGVALGSAQPLLARLGPDERQRIARTLLQTVMDQLLQTGVFHVDLHPGNVLVAHDGTLSMLDLGSVGRLGAKTRRTMGQFLAAIATGDSVAATDALLELVDRPEAVDERSLEQALGVLILRFGAGSSTDGAAAFTSLFGLINEFRLGVPPEVAAVFRAMATLESTLTVIDPGYDLITEAKEMGRQRMAGMLGPSRLRDTMEQELGALLPILRRLPHRVDRIGDALEHGRLTANVRLFADARDRRIVTDLVHRTLLTVLAATAGMMSVVLFTIRGGPMVTAQASLFTVLGTILFMASVVLVLRVLIVVLRRDE
jgi:ubiquinone biosynthesis protein